MKGLFGSEIAPLTVIPPMTNPLGRHWSQPDPSQFLIDDKHALMTIWELNQLPDYSATIPTGVYAGKMWRCRYVDSNKMMGWLLYWFTDSKVPNHCDINVRKVLLV